MNGALQLARFAGMELLEAVLSSAAQRLIEVPMTNKAHVVHHIPGRVRLRIPAKRHQPGFFQDVKQRLEKCDNVSAVAVNPASGSLLIRYHGEIEDLLAHAATVGLLELLDVTDELPALEPIADQLVSRLGDFDKRVSVSTSGALDGRSTLLIGFLIAATIQALRGQFFGPAIPLLWYAAQALGGGLPGKSAPTENHLALKAS